MMTKNLDSVKVQKFTSMLQQVFGEGRSCQGLRVQRSGGGGDRGSIARVEQIAATAVRSRIEGRAEMSRQGLTQQAGMSPGASKPDECQPTTTQEAGRSPGAGKPDEGWPRASEQASQSEVIKGR